MKPTKNILLSIAVAATSLSASAAVDFDKVFNDSTLRLDYIYSGKADKQNVSLQAMHASEGWYGRRHNLDRVPLQGKGQITMTDAATGDTIYRTAFSDLFLEWLETDEAKTTARAMQATQNVPMPKNAANVTVTLFNHRNEPITELTHQVDPTDILIKRHRPDNITPHRYILKSGDPKEKIDVAILAEGYTEAEMDTFYVHAAKAGESILSHSPFKDMADRFNFVAVASPSKDSGVSIPRFNDWKSTAFSSHFSTFYSNRYLTTSNVYDIHNVLAGIPYEHLVILANTNEYGGGGIFNAYTLTTARNPLFWPVVTHEFGHSFGGLADEYFYEHQDTMNDTYPLDIEPWEQNVTTMIDFDSKWKDMIKPGTPIPTPVADAEKIGVGAYEGAAYSTKGIYRPVDHCRMRDNFTKDFCPVCSRSLARIIDFYTIEEK